MPARAKRFYLCNLIPLWEIDEPDMEVDWPAFRAAFGELIEMRADIQNRKVKWTTDGGATVSPDLKVRFEVYESDFLLSGGLDDHMGTFSSHADFGGSPQLRSLKIVPDVDKVPEADREKFLFLQWSAAQDITVTATAPDGTATSHTERQPDTLRVRGWWRVTAPAGGDVSGGPEFYYDVFVEGKLEDGSGLSLHERADHELDGFDRQALLFLPAAVDPDYENFVQPPTTGLVKPLIHGRSSNGAGPDVDLTEPLDEMETLVKSLAAGDSVFLSAWFFSPATKLLRGSFNGAADWGHLFAEKAKAGITIRIIINDFDPVTHFDRWLQSEDLAPLNAIIAGLPLASRDQLKYVVSMHPAHFGPLKALIAGQPARPIFVASHHQKFMVVRSGSETIAFCGGVDIELRKTPDQWSYRRMIGWHDLHVRLEGPIALDLMKEFVGRWNREKDHSTKVPLAGWSAFESLAVPPLGPLDDAPAKKLHRVQMLRTVSADGTFGPFSTRRDDIKKMYRQAISAATRYIYMENQYFRSAELGQWLAAQLESRPQLVMILVVVASAGADDGDNAVTKHGDFLQFETFRQVLGGSAAARTRLYTMHGRAVHAKFLLVDDDWMTIGSANANVRSFEMDSELNVRIFDADLVSAFRKRLWSHNLGVPETDLGAWPVADFLGNWDAVARANEALLPNPAKWPEMTGEGIVRFDFTKVKGTKSSLIPDAVAELDIAPEGGLFAGDLPGGVVHRDIG